MISISTALGLLTLFALAMYVLHQALNLYRIRAHQEAGFIVQRQMWEAKLAAVRQRVDEVRQDKHGWNGWRRFEVKRKRLENESGTICSFYLFPQDGQPLPPFEPGQFLTLKIPERGKGSQVIRCYSLSERPRDDYYRVSIRRMPGGRGSGTMHDAVQEGDWLDVRAPAGEFCIEVRCTRPLVMMAGGVGLTPFLSMMSALAHHAPGTEAWLFYSVCRREDLIQLGELKRLCGLGRNLNLVICVTDDPNPETLPPEWERERISSELLARYLPSLNYDFYFCGPPPMMRAIESLLKKAGVAADRIHYENFAPPALSTDDSAEDEAMHTVSFSRAGKASTWNGAHTNLLQFATAAGAAIPTGCCVGNCGTCRTAIRKGEVEYFVTPGISDLREDECLPCICRPRTDLVLDV